MSAPILLSSFLRGLSGKDLPPEVEEHRVRLRRSGSDVSSIDRSLQKWAAILADERVRAETRGRAVGSAELASKEEASGEEEAQKGIARAAQELARALEEANQRTLADAPTLDGYDELIRFFKQRRVYVPEPFVPRDFVPEDEHTNEEYKQLLLEAANVAFDRARKSFTPQVRRFSWAIGVLGLISLNSFGVSIFLYHDNPVRLSIGLLLCFDTLLAIAYIFYRMSRSKEFQLKAYIQSLMDGELKRARAEVARREEERYKVFLEEERERRETFEQDQEKKRAAFDRSEAMRLESLQPLLSGKIAAVQAVVASLFPLKLAIPCGVTFKVISASVVEISLQLPDDRILPPWMQPGSRRSSSSLSREEAELPQQCAMLAAGYAIRHAAEVLFHVPSCNTVVVTGLRALVDPDTRVAMSSQVLHAEIDRKTLTPMGRTMSPLLAIRRFKHRFSAPERTLERNSA